METGWQAFQLSLAGFLIPYAFVFNPAIGVQGSWDETLWTAGSLLLGIYALSGAIMQYLFRLNRRWETLCLWASAFLLISPESITDGIGLLVLLLVALNQARRTPATQAVENRPV
jgi:TRAP-type uncharacterized transport system fused permease subunit